MEPLTPEDIERLIAPWTNRRFRTSDVAWREIVEAEHAIMRRKNIKRRRRSLKGFLSFLKGSFRDVGFVRKHYSATWAGRGYFDANRRSGEKLDHYDWGEHGFEFRLGGAHSFYLEALARAFESLRPSTALEVGCGMGANLMVLANLMPDVAFAGIELTEEGVQRAKDVQATDFPEGLAAVSPRPVADPEAFRRVEFSQGDASAMPYPDKSFDVVFTVLAVEQMEAVRDAAMAEIVRVARSHVILLEPFMEANADPLRSLSQRAKDHVRLAIADLPRYGLEVESRYLDWPQKLTNGIGMAVAKVVR